MLLVMFLHAPTEIMAQPSGGDTLHKNNNKSPFKEIWNNKYLQCYRRSKFCKASLQM